MLTARQAEEVHDGMLDDPLAMIDGANVRAHQQAAGAAQRGFAPQRGRSRGGWGSTLPRLTERTGTPIVVALTAGQRQERPQALPLQEWERLGPEAVAGATGDSDRDRRTWLQPQESDAVIPSRDDAWGP